MTSYSAPKKNRLKYYPPRGADSLVRMARNPAVEKSGYDTAVILPYNSLGRMQLSQAARLNTARLTNRVNTMEKKKR